MDGTMRDFEEKVVLPDLYEEKLIAVYDKEDAHASQAEQRIREARQALDSGMSFDQVVLQYSDGRTKEIGGDLGWFLLKNLSKNLQPSVAKQKVGIVGDVIESEIGFHIILVEGTKQEGEQTFYRLKQVFVKKKTAADWLTERMRASPPIILSREYVWDAETARIEFQKSDMKQFEQELFEENQKNTSFIP
jgi:parvulin-like peptidyl-prolyl isomerase